MSAAAHARARTATLVTVGPPERLAEAAAVLSSLDRAGSLRHVLLSTSPGTSLPPAAGLQDVTTVEDLHPQFLNNAIAAHRLSSLPTAIWWRGGPAATVEGAASLAERVILDVEEPRDLWTRVQPLLGRSAFSDIRWGRLTRWRAVLAVLFDVPEVRQAAGAVEELTLSGSDRAQGALFAGWLDASLDWAGRVEIRVEVGAGPSLAGVLLRGPGLEVRLELLPNGICLATQAVRRGETIASRVVPLGNAALGAVLSEELRIRSRDVAFERALARALPILGRA